MFIGPLPVSYGVCAAACLSNQDLQVNSKCEVSSSRKEVKKWYEATVGAVKYEDGKRLLYIEVRTSSPRFVAGILWS